MCCGMNRGGGSGINPVMRALMQLIRQMSNDGGCGEGCGGGNGNNSGNTFILGFNAGNNNSFSG